MSTPAKEVKKDKSQPQAPSSAAPTPAPAPAAAKKERDRDPWLDEKDAIIKAWRAAGNKGIPDHVKVKDFKRVGQRRLDDACHALELLANLGNRSSYSYTPEQVGKIMEAIDARVQALVTAFTDKAAGSSTVEL